jgi:hypothetical protein
MNNSAGFQLSAGRFLPSDGLTSPKQDGNLGRRTRFRPKRCRLRDSTRRRSDGGEELKVKAWDEASSSAHKALASLRPSRALAERVFPVSISICLLFAEFIIEKCFLAFCRRCCHCFVIVTAAPAPLGVFVSRLLVPARVIPFARSISAPAPAHVPFRPANIHTNSILKLDTPSRSALELLLEVFKFYFNVCAEH